MELYNVITIIIILTAIFGYINHRFIKMPGTISVALALSLPKYMYGEMFVSITYIVVLFSIVFQGLTIGKFAVRLAHKEEQKPMSEIYKNN